MLQTDSERDRSIQSVDTNFSCDSGHSKAVSNAINSYAE